MGYMCFYSGDSRRAEEPLQREEWHKKLSSPALAEEATLKASSRGPTHTSWRLFLSRPVRRGMGRGSSPPQGFSIYLCEGVQSVRREKARSSAACCGQHPPFSSARGPPPRRHHPPASAETAAKVKTRVQREFIYLFN